MTIRPLKFNNWDNSFGLFGSTIFEVVIGHLYSWLFMFGASRSGFDLSNGSGFDLWNRSGLYLWNRSGLDLWYGSSFDIWN
jgi:hypothetical protein